MHISAACKVWHIESRMMQNQCQVLLPWFVQGDVLLSFTPEATGVTWPAYVDLYCAGAKQLFFHEKPKVQLQLEPVTLSNL